MGSEHYIAIYCILRCHHSTLSTMPKAYSQDTLDSVLSLLDSNNSHAEIMAKLGVSSGYISKVTAKYRSDLKRSTGGRPHKLNPTATRHAVCLVTNGSSINTRRATQTLSTLTGESISTKTVRRALKRAGLRPVKKV
jgi:transposase